MRASQLPADATAMLASLDAPLFVLFAVIALGLALGSIRLGGLSLGSAGVLFVALLAGHLGRSVPEEVTELGLALFVYAVGLQTGPRFVGLLRARGATFAWAGVLSAIASALVAFGAGRLSGLPAALIAGLYAGATTCTPALAAALDAIAAAQPEHVPLASVGYGVAYPLCFLAVVLYVQLLPRLLRVQPADAAEQARREQEAISPPLAARAFAVTNPNCIGRTVQDLGGLRVSGAQFSRIKRDGAVRVARPEEKLALGDVVLAVGTAEDLAPLEAVLGPVVAEPMADPAGDVVSEEVLVSRPEAVGKSLRALRAWARGVVVTRVRREGIELRPSGAFVLEPADQLRVVGTREGVESFARAVGQQERRLEETSLLPFALGLAAGVLLGQVPLPLPGGLSTRLGTAGGAFLVALALGHWGRIGRSRVYVPTAAKHFARELGLVIFLAGAGTSAGSQLATTLAATGLQLVLAGVLVTLATLAVSTLVLARLLRWNLLATAGGVSACMTNPPALSAASRLADSDAAPLAFASLYPVALISKILLAQALVLVAQVLP